MALEKLANAEAALVKAEGALATAQGAREAAERLLAVEQGRCMQEAESKVEALLRAQEVRKGMEKMETNWKTVLLEKDVLVKEKDVLLRRVEVLETEKKESSSLGGSSEERGALVENLTAELAATKARADGLQEERGVIFCLLR